MTTGTSKFSIASPLEHLDIVLCNPVRPCLLNQRFHKSEKNRKKNEPYQKHKDLESTMRQ